MTSTLEARIFKPELPAAAVAGLRPSSVSCRGVMQFAAQAGVPAAQALAARGADHMIEMPRAHDFNTLLGDALGLNYMLYTQTHPHWTLPHATRRRMHWIEMVRTGCVRVCECVRVGLEPSLLPTDTLCC